jgi:hypothetical protein
MLVRTRNIGEKRDCNVYYGCQKNKHEFGCGFIVNKKNKTSGNGLHTNRLQICILRVRGRFNNMSLICAHAPTEEKSGNIKDTFYDAVEKAF